MSSLLGRLARLTGLLLLGLLLLGMAGWGTLALLYFGHASPLLRHALASAYAVATIGGLVGFARTRWRWKAFGVSAGLFVLVVACWSAIEPSNDRTWQPDVARLADATIDGDHVTLHNIRNFDYRSETDYTPAYYDRSFDLRQLDSVDLIAAYWMGPAIAHVFVSFGFTDGSHVAISIEARKEQGESYSSVQGFFRQYELYYVVADERDVIRLRTNYRRDPPEDVYLYRLHAPAENARRLFLEYLRKVNGLERHAEFYNSLTTNCTSNIWMHSRVNPGHVPYSWKILLSGYVPQFLYERGKLDTSMPFDELKERSRVNALAQAADKAEDFSQRIRAGQRHP